MTVAEPAQVEQNGGKLAGAAATSEGRLSRSAMRAVGGRIRWHAVGRTAACAAILTALVWCGLYVENEWRSMRAVYRARVEMTATRHVQPAAPPSLNNTGCPRDSRAPPPFVVVLGTRRPDDADFDTESGSGSNRTTHGLHAALEALLEERHRSSMECVPILVVDSTRQEEGPHHAFEHVWQTVAAAVGEKNGEGNDARRWQGVELMTATLAPRESGGGKKNLQHAQWTRAALDMGFRLARAASAAPRADTLLYIEDDDVVCEGALSEAFSALRWARRVDANWRIVRLALGASGLLLHRRGHGLEGVLELLAAGAGLAPPAVLVSHAFDLTRRGYFVTERVLFAPKYVADRGRHAEPQCGSLMEPGMHGLGESDGFDPSHCAHASVTPCEPDSSFRAALHDLVDIRDSLWRWRDRAQAASAAAAAKTKQ